MYRYISSLCLLNALAAGSHPSVTLAFPLSEDVCGVDVFFSLFFSPPFISLDFGSDHFDLILSFDSLTRSFAMPVGYNPISVMTGEVS